MKFHPHLHILTNSDIKLSCKFNALWRKVVLGNLNLISNKYYYGYYVWSDNIKSKNIAKYVARYIRHPAIANSRIISYGKDYITFYFNDEKQQIIFIRKSVNDFITSLIQNIPPKQFKMIRYYGAYSKNKE